MSHGIMTNSVIIVRLLRCKPIPNDRVSEDGGILWRSQRNRLASEDPKTGGQKMSNVEPAATGAGRNRIVTAVFAVVLVSAALYFGRVVFEPIAFMLFTMALVEPFQKAAEVRFGKPVALILTIILTLLFLSILVWAIVWSISDI